MTDNNKVENAFLGHRSAETSENIKKITDAANALAKESDYLREELIKSRDLCQRVKNEQRELSAQGEALAQKNSQLQELVTKLEQQVNEKEAAIDRLELALEKSEAGFASQIETLTKSHAQLDAQVTKLTIELQKSTQDQQSQEAEIKRLEEEATAEKKAYAIAQSQQESLNKKIEKLKAENIEYRHIEKENHDLNLALLEKENQYAALKEQSEKKIATLQKSSSAVEQMRNMLAQFDNDPIKEKIESYTADSPTTESPLTAEDQPSQKLAHITTTNLMDAVADDSLEAWLNPKGKTHDQPQDDIILSK